MTVFSVLPRLLIANPYHLSLVHLQALYSQLDPNSRETLFYKLNFCGKILKRVFVGFDNPATLGKRETGSSVAAPIFRDFMSQALHKKPDIPFRRPTGIKLIKVNPKTGLLAKSNSKNYIIEAFKPGQLPNKTSEFDIIDTPKEKDIVNSLSPLY